MSDEEINRLIREWNSTQDPMILLQLLLLLIRSGLDVGAVLEQLGLTSAGSILRALGLSEEVIAALEKAILDYNLSGGTTAGQILRRAAAINKIKEILGKVPQLSIDILKRIGILEVSFIGVAEAGGIVLSGPMAILGGLLLPATKWYGGLPEIDLGGWWRDPCDELFSRISEAYADHMQERGNFPTGFTSGSPSVMHLLSSAGHITTLCGKFLKDCPLHKRTTSIQFINQKMSGYAAEYYDL